eukprot:CAMPEP_0197824904 /NCGR_PEP_ID=MMETSP1437-20131217/2093_1 /TAXON_ID=49252 ORGANISM="Eucampia antarctica, Strain CCMP1452" /NCGR_SAMPLE_ID=MMETSP1437 /ASSEMBLY_ACC=CAM_ASM_001096 /LENGTH=759 /DNA_ID=CAMNT_0043424709 /DNA_START=118 /DNA_END=2397 /DNA_ORIENTATION=-
MATTTTTTTFMEEALLMDKIQSFFPFSINNSYPEEKKLQEEGEEVEEEEEDEKCPSTSNDGGKTSHKVVIELEQEVVDNLPIMTLEEVEKCNGLKEGEKMLVTYEGIVYDVTEFANAHPGGRELLRTAAGMDMKHYFDNYTVHSQTDKASRWLAPLAVGKLASSAEIVKAQQRTTPQAHVHKRHILLNKARTQILWVASSLPLWISLRAIVRMVGCVIPSLARCMASALPVSVPGYTAGSEPLLSSDLEEEDVAVAVIGGGIAGCGAAWALSQSGFRVVLYEARKQVSGNARTFDWDFSEYPHGGIVRSCVSVTAWPSNLYKNYTALLQHLNIETVHQPLSWFLNSKVPGYEGHFWGADPRVYEGSLRKVFEEDFRLYSMVNRMVAKTSEVMKLRWAPWRWNDSESMYDNHTGLNMLNPFNVVPLYSLFRMVGGTNEWWDIIFTPFYTASFLVDELRPFPAVFGPLIEAQIPLNPNSTNSWQGSSKHSEHDCNITTCVTWKDAGKGIRAVFDQMTKDVIIKEDTRVLQIQVLPNGKKRVYDEFDNHVDVDRVIFACPSNAVGNIYPQHGKLEEVILNTPVYADDHHPSSGHMHAVMHSDPKMIEEPFREECLKRASNYVEVTRNDDESINIENQYNFGVQTPGLGIYDMPLKDKPAMLISHSPGKGKIIDPELVRGTGNHARAHPLYSGWNVAAQLSLRLVQGKNGIYYCSNWTTPGNCHDMSLLSGIVCAHAVGAKYPFEKNVEAKKDFFRLRDWMGV